MNRLRLGTLLVLLSQGCGFSYVPITDEEVRELGVTEGLAGSAAMLSGDCMPGVGCGGCGHEPLQGELWIVPESSAGALGRRQGYPGVDLASVKASDLGATVVGDLEQGHYAVALPPGRYMPVIREPDGRGGCEWNAIGTDRYVCPLVQVDASRVTKFDLLLDKAAY